MTSLLVLLGLVVVAGVPYILWTRSDARSHSKATQVHEDVLAMGDEFAPTSIHPDIDLDACIGSTACIKACPEHDVIAITDGRVRLINPLSCVGHGACMSACPVSAITLVFGTATRGVELPKISPTFETNQQGVYIVGELGGMGLIRNAVSQGKQAADAIAKSGRRGAGGDLDVLVVGSGPSGIAATLALIAHGLNVMLVEQDKFGGTIAHYPRAKVVMTGSFQLAGYGTVRRKTMSKEQLLELWGDIRQKMNLPITEGVRVEGLKAEGKAWRVTGTNNWNIRAANVVLGLGRRGAPRQIGCPGEDLPKVAYRLIEPEPFADKHVLVVGGGNAAADCAIALAQAGICKSVGLSYRKTELARLRSSVRVEIDASFKRGTIKPLLGTEVVSIAEDHVMLKSKKGVERIDNDNVIVQIGGLPPSALLKTIGIELVEKRGEA